MNDMDRLRFASGELERARGEMIALLDRAIETLNQISETLAPAEVVYDGDCDWCTCANCGAVLDKRYGNCPGCGKKVNWL